MPQFAVERSNNERSLAYHDSHRGASSSFQKGNSSGSI